MIIRNIIVMNGHEVDYEELSNEDKRRVTNTLNKTSLNQLNYVEEKTT